MTTDPQDIAGLPRLVLGLCGLLLVGVATVATFATSNAAAAVAFLVAGLITILLALVGRWPERLIVGGNGVEWTAQRLAEELRERAENSPPEVAANLDRVADEIVGLVPTAGPESYDHQVAGALSRCFPEARLVRERYRSDARYDFLLKFEDGDVWVETKFVKPPSNTFRGSRMRPLVDAAIAGGARLAVVVNVPEIEGAAKLLAEQLGDRGSVVTWVGPMDDPALVRAVSQLRTV